MPTHDYIIANGTGAAVRADINAALSAIVSLNSSASEPGTMYAYQLWADTTSNLLKIRNSANSAWITLRQLDGDFSIVAVEDGLQATPSLTFTNDLNTGIFRPGNDSLSIVTNALRAITITSTQAVGIQTANPSTALHVAGNARVGADDTTDAHLQIGKGATGNRNSYIDIVGDTTYTDYGLRVIRNNGGADATSEIKHRGTGAFNIVTQEAAPIQFYTTNSPRLTITSGGNVGIGTSAPNYQLHATTSFAVGASGFNQQLSFTNDTIQSLLLGTGYTSLKLNPLGGNVGIGSTAPDAKLLVSDGTNINTRIGQLSLDNFTGEGAGIRFSRTTSDDSLCALGTLNAGDGDLGLFSRNNLIFATGGASFYSSTIESARIDSSGRLLVGTASARTDYFNNNLTAMLQVEGTNSSGAADRACVSIVNNNSVTVNESPVLVFGRSNGSTLNSKTIVGNGTRCGYISFQGADGSDLIDAASIAGEIDGTPGANDMPGRLVFSTTADGAASPTERMRINSSGAFKASSNGSYTGATSVYHEFYQTNNTSGLYIRGTNASQTATILEVNGDRITTNATYSLIDAYNGNVSGRFSVRDSGNAVNTNNSYGGISDVKLKENIVDAGSQWADIKAFRVRKYNFKEGQTHTQIGGIAQEVELVSPGLVYESPDRDEKGNDLGTVTKSVNYSVLYMKAVKALQEAMERIETLEARLTAAGID